MLRRHSLYADVVQLDRTNGALSPAEAQSGEESGVYDVIGAMPLAVYRVGDDLFVHAGGRELPIRTLTATLRRGWVRSRLGLRQGTEVIADLRYPGRWTEVAHRMDAYAYPDDELDFGLFLARRINEPWRQPHLFSGSPRPPGSSQQA